MRSRKIITAFAAVVVLGMLIPEDAVIPVQGASPNDWNQRSFWFEPWGVSGVHKGIDIFAAAGTTVTAATPGILLYRGQLGSGGNVVAILGPKWRIHYFAHLRDAASIAPFLIHRGAPIGAVGTSGNAKGKPPHLHYAVMSLLPMPWRYSGATQGWKQMFFLNPAEVLAPN